MTKKIIKQGIVKKFNITLIFDLDLYSILANHGHQISISFMLYINVLLMSYTEGEITLIWSPCIATVKMKQNIPDGKQNAEMLGNATATQMLGNSPLGYRWFRCY